MSDWLWSDLDDEPTDEELEDIEFNQRVFPDGFCCACGAPAEELAEYAECSNCGERVGLYEG